MRKEKFKFELNQRVFLLGKTGICIVLGRGVMEFSSGGERCMYAIAGAHDEFVAEETVLSVDEAKELLEL
jgi:hypothetical protein